MRKLNIGLLGLGQIGTGVYSVLRAKHKLYQKELGVSFDLVKVADVRKERQRALRIPAGVFTTDAFEVIRDPKIDVIIELIGGTRVARKVVLEALRHGKHVVTANKALLAEFGDEVFGLAVRRRRMIAFEASVGGGIPVIKALREGLVANRIESIHSIINGTSNYILTRMTQDGLDFQVALKQAQAKGYAEADPTLDVEGIDAAHKLAILVRFAFGGKVRFKDIHCEGISEIRSEDIAFAEEFGYRIKLLAIAKASAAGIEARVQPTLLPKAHILANVNEAFNAVLLRGDEVGDVLFYGRGAGQRPTTSAIISDLTDIAKRMPGRLEDEMILLRGLRARLKVKNISSILSRYYLRFHVIDRPGVLAKISRVLGAHSISISDCVQKETSAGKIVPLILLTHHAHERDVRDAIRLIARLDVIRGKSQVIRIEGN
ncbi:MAG: homoserine dehydrogenase [Candidatus Omnitrophica bacterium]|nr:homoserine dehydrogenase [Candidatus Omnitrophota bacterium]MDD5672155.1 homoserine dehydrogenase [Candidatus Omnitrophota bacterium]